MALFLAALVVVVVHGGNAEQEGGGCYGYTRLFAFGDSIIDNGNWMHYARAPGPVARPPYGETFFHRPTGRFSNGKLIVDYIAEALEVPYLTPYLAANSSKDCEHGANFAVGGATALDRGYFRRKNLTVQFTPYSLGAQMRWLEKTLQMLNSSSKQGWGELMASSLFLVGEIGGNDYNQLFFHRRPVGEVRTYVPDVVDAIGAAIVHLIRLGAKTVVVPGNLPLGCTPGYLTMFWTNDTAEYDAVGCLRWLNYFAEYHNRALKARLAELARRYPDVTVVYADYYHAVMNLTTDPRGHGFDDKPLVSCCGGGGPYNVDWNVTCGAKEATTCSDPYKAVSWDGFHLTDHAYELIAGGVLHGPYAAPPVPSKCQK